MEYYQVIKKNETAIYSKVEGPRHYHIKQSKPDKYNYHMISLLSGI